MWMKMTMFLKHFSKNDIYIFIHSFIHSYIYLFIYFSKKNIYNCHYSSTGDPKLL